MMAGGQSHHAPWPSASQAGPIDGVGKRTSKLASLSSKAKAKANEQQQQQQQGFTSASQLGNFRFDHGK